MLQVSLKLLPLLSAIPISFAFGYGVRELISRRRRAAGRERYFRRQREKKYYQRLREECLADPDWRQGMARAHQPHEASDDLRATGIPLE